MNLSHIRSMILAAERGSISAASKELFIHSVSLLQQINQLEADVGFRIFHRSHRGVTLTKAGQALYDGAKRSLAEMDALLNACRQMDAQSDSMIHISMYRPYDFIRFCEAYNGLNPNIAFQYGHVEMRGSSWLMDNLNTGCYDVIQAGSDQIFAKMREKIDFLPVERDRLCCFCAQNHPLAQRKSVTLQELKAYRLFSLDCDETAIINQLDEKLRAIGCDMPKYSIATALQ